MDTVLIESVGWFATAVVVTSFFFADPNTLRKVQILGASLWLAYGIAIGSLPVIVANVLVVTAATLTTIVRSRRARVAEAWEEPFAACEVNGTRCREAPRPR